MYADLDELVLSGKLFNSDPRSSSPTRTPSPDSKSSKDWPNLEKADIDEYSSDAEREKLIASIMRNAPQDAPDSAIGMGPGRTGVKGVIRDRAEANERARETRAREIQELNKRMEKASLGGKTFLEEERERQIEEALREGRLGQLGGNELEGFVPGKGKMRFGHLREVGVKNFVSAVEKEERNVFVVVHLYDPSLERCYNLDSDLSRLARLHPDTKFLRARATALGFATTSTSSSKRSPSIFTSSVRSSKPTIRNAPRRIVDGDEDDDDPYAYDDEKEKDAVVDSDEDAEGDGDAEADTDVLPTMLVYRAGELEHTWVRVDWEAGASGIDDLLARHHILRGGSAGFGGSRAPDVDELWASDPE